MRQNVHNCNSVPAAATGETPVDRLVAVFGRRRVAELAELTTDAVDKWNRRTSTGGGGGLVPSRYQHLFLSAARKEGLPLAAEDFIAEPVK